MLVKKIIKLCKQTGAIWLYDAPDCQWISNGGALYPLCGLPVFDEDTIITAYDLPPEKVKIIMNRISATGLDVSDASKAEFPCELLDFSYSGAFALKTQSGVSFIQSKYLEPIDNSVDSVSFWERKTDKGDSYFVIKVGLQIQGIVMPYKVINDNFVKKMQEFSELCELALENETERE